MYPDDNTTTASFTGKILMQNLNGSFINEYKVKEGIIIAQYIKKNQINAVTSKNIIIDGVTFTDYDVVIVTNYYHNPRNSINFMSLYTGFADTGSESDSSGMNWDYGNGGGGGGPVTPTDEGVANYIEDNIDDSELDECPKAVLEKLKNTTNTGIKTILETLGSSKVFNVNIVSGCAGRLSAQSTSPTPFNYTTTVSQDYTLATKLFRASNLLHEIAHVNFMSIVDDFKAQGYSQTNYNLKSFPTLFQAYCDKKYPPSNTTAANAHHLEMANQYVDAIGSALQEYNKLNDPEGIIPYQVYSDLAWGGLIDAPVFYEKFTPGNTDEIRIKNRYASESVGHKVGSESPVGKPCN